MDLLESDAVLVVQVLEVLVMVVGIDHALVRSGHLLLDILAVRQEPQTAHGSELRLRLRDCLLQSGNHLTQQDPALLSVVQAILVESSQLPAALFAARHGKRTEYTQLLSPGKFSTALLYYT